jgi:radical SAM protein with 4Fe4S-binding SPASM domain
MPFDTATALIRDCAEIGTRNIHICGYGESLLYPRIKEIVALTKRSGMNIYITTNGFMLNHDMIDSFGKSGLDGLYVSLNAASAGTYASIHIGSKGPDFSRIIENISYIKSLNKERKKDIYVSLSFVLMSVNYKEVVDFIRLAEELKADEIIFRELGTGSLKDKSLVLDDTAKGWLKGIAVELKAGIKHNLGSLCEEIDSGKGGVECCAGYIGGTLITADGRVYPCCNCSAPVGNIKDERFKTIWHSRPYQKFRDAGKRMGKHRGAFPAGCLCDTCPTYTLNRKVQSILYPWKKT